jgi:hypothetical protein
VAANEALNIILVHGGFVDGSGVAGFIAKAASGVTVGSA